MAEQNFEYDQYAPQTGGRLFSNAMFGFNKEEVLEYLDELADENYQRQEAAELRIQELMQRIAGLEDIAANQPPPPAAEPSEEDRQRMAELADELDIAKAATQQAEEDLAEVRDQLYNLQQENAWLREEYQKNDMQMADLRRRLDEAGSSQPMAEEARRQAEDLQRQLDAALQQAEDLQSRLDEALEAQPAAEPASAAIIAEANVEADRIRAVAEDEKERIRRQIRSSAGGLAQSITHLRGEVTDVEGGVSKVLESVQNSLTDVLSALTRTEQNLNTLGVQVDRFPSPAAPVPKPQQVVYFQPGAQPIGPAPARRSKSAQAPESLGQGGFQRVWPGSNTAASSKLRPFRPTYSSSPTAQAAYWPQTTEAYAPDDLPLGEERIRALAETLVETLVQMLN